MLKNVLLNLIFSSSFLFQFPGRGFVNTWVGVFRHFESIRPCDAAVGFASIGILLFLRVRNVHLIAPTRQTLYLIGSLMHFNHVQYHVLYNNFTPFSFTHLRHYLNTQLPFMWRKIQS